MEKKLRQLDFNLLKALDLLLDERNVTRAAERMAVTQSAMSGMLARLRENFDDPLFVRSQYGVLPTARAEELAAPLKALLANVSALLSPQEFDPKTLELTVKIGATDYGFHCVALPFMQALKQQAPKVKVALLSIQEGNISQRLAKGELDFALIALEDVPDICSAMLYHERYVCAMRASHPAAHKPLDLDQFCALEQALISYQGGQFSGVTDQALQKLGRTRKVTTSINSFLLLPEILLQSDLIAVVPERLVRGRTDLFVCEPPFEIAGFTKGLGWSKRTEHHPAYRWLRELFVSCFKQD